MFRTLTSPDFFDGQGDHLPMFAYILFALTRKLNLPPADIRLVINIFTKTLKRNVESNSSRATEILMGLLVQLYGPENRYNMEVNELYYWLLGYINEKRNFSGAGVALLNIMTARPPSDLSLLQKCIPELLKVAKRYGIAENTKKLSSIIFMHF